MKNMIINIINAIRLNTIIQWAIFLSVQRGFELYLIHSFFFSNRGFLKGTAFILAYQGFQLIEVSMYFKTNIFGNTFPLSLFNCI